MKPGRTLLVRTMKRSPIVYLTLFCIVTSFPLLGQGNVYTIPMPLQKGVGPYRYLTTSGTVKKDVQDWKGLPSITDSLRIFSFAVPALYTPNPPSAPLPLVYVLSYIENGIKTISCDTDGDQDFGDETKSRYPLSMKEARFAFDSLPYLRASLVRDSLHRNVFIWLKLVPFDASATYKTPLESLLQVYFTPLQVRMGRVVMAGSPHYFYASTSSFTKIKHMINLSPTPKPDGFRFDPGVGYFPGDTLQINNKSYQITWKNSSYDTLICTELKGLIRSTGFMVNQYLPLDKLVRLDGPAQALTQPKRLTIIDFWGTWCGPCIAEIPALTRFYQGMDQQKYTLISVAYDTDIEKVRAFTSDHAMSWTNLFVDKGVRTNVLARYHVLLFPTLLVADSTGKVLFSTSNRTVESLQAFLKTLPN